MLDIAYEPISKSYFSSYFSRGFCLAYFCYIMIVVIPILVLISIQYSWPEYRRVILFPQTFEFRAYQIVCYSSSNQITYNSNFNGESITKNYNHIVSVSASIDQSLPNKSRILVSGTIISSNVTSCNLQLYFHTRIQTATVGIVHLPLSISAKNQTQFLNKATIKGTVAVVSNGQLPQSSILTNNGSYYGSGYPQTFIDNYLTSTNKKLALKITQNYRSVQKLTTNSNPVTFLAEYKITGSWFFKTTNLMDKLRLLIPIFMFLSICLWVLVVNPLVDWMISNGIYTTRTKHPKLKGQ